jgi:methyl-accepting chemotaxis protein
LGRLALVRSRHLLVKDYHHQIHRREGDAIAGLAERSLWLDEIANVVAVAIQQQGGVIQEIAQSASGAAAGTHDVSKNIDQVSRSSIEAGHVAKAVLDAAGELAARSDTLRGEVERFLLQVRVA